MSSVITFVSFNTIFYLFVLVRGGVGVGVGECTAPADSLGLVVRGAGFQPKHGHEGAI
jgi:hypothetical protein